MAMATFNVSAWFYVDIDVPFEEGTDEYEEAVEDILINLEGSHALLTTSYDTYLTDNIEVEHLG
jgi:hypothetical protein